MNIFPLGSYDMIIGMDYLERYKLVLDCLCKTFTYVAKDKIVRKVKGISKHVSLRQLVAMQLKNCMRKGCMIYVVWVTELLLSKIPTHVSDPPFLSDFMDLFPEEIPGLPPQREIDFYH